MEDNSDAPPIFTSTPLCLIVPDSQPDVSSSETVRECSTISPKTERDSITTSKSGGHSPVAVLESIPLFPRSISEGSSGSGPHYLSSSEPSSLLSKSPDTSRASRVQLEGFSSSSSSQYPRSSSHSDNTSTALLSSDSEKKESPLSEKQPRLPSTSETLHSQVSCHIKFDEQENKKPIGVGTVVTYDDEIDKSGQNTKDNDNRQIPQSYQIENERVIGADIVETYNSDGKLLTYKYSTVGPYVTKTPNVLPRSGFSSSEHSSDELHLSKCNSDDLSTQSLVGKAQSTPVIDSEKPGLSFDSVSVISFKSSSSQTLPSQKDGSKEFECLQLSRVLSSGESSKEEVDKNTDSDSVHLLSAMPFVLGTPSAVEDSCSAPMASRKIRQGPDKLDTDRSSDSEPQMAVEEYLSNIASDRESITLPKWVVTELPKSQIKLTSSSESEEKTQDSNVTSLDRTTQDEISGADRDEKLSFSVSPSKHHDYIVSSDRSISSSKEALPGPSGFRKEDTKLSSEQGSSIPHPELECSQDLFNPILSSVEEDANVCDKEALAIRTTTVTDDKQPTNSQSESQFTSLGFNLHLTQSQIDNNTDSTVLPDLHSSLISDKCIESQENPLPPSIPKDASQDNKEICTVDSDATKVLPDAVQVQEPMPSCSFGLPQRKEHNGGQGSGLFVIHKRRILTKQLKCYFAVERLDSKTDPIEATMTEKEEIEELEQEKKHLDWEGAQSYCNSLPESTIRSLLMKFIEREEGLKTSPNLKKRKREGQSGTTEIKRARTRSETSLIAHKLAPGSHVFAEWKDGFYYGGTIISESKRNANSSLVKFDDGDVLNVPNERLVDSDALPDGQEVLVADEDKNFRQGIVMESCRLSAKEYGYVVCVADTNAIQKFAKAQISLTVEQFNSLKTDLPTMPEKKHHILPPAITTATTAKKRLGKRKILRPRKARQSKVAGVLESSTSPEDPRPIAKRPKRLPPKPTCSSLVGGDSLTPSGDDSEAQVPVPVDKTIFRGLVFLVTKGVKSKEEKAMEVETSSSAEDMTRLVRFNRSLIKQRLQEGGGLVFDSITPEMEIDRRNAFLVADKCQTTEKYLFALAFGMVCLSYTWVIDSCMHNQRKDYRNYVLAAGKDRITGTIVEMCYRGKPLQNVRVHVHDESSHLATWYNILKAAGAEVVTRLPANVARMLEADSQIPDVCDIIMVLTDREPRSLAHKAELLNIPMVTENWLIQCLIKNKPVSPSELEKLRYSRKSK